jgi:large subunit ribosomal protein L10
MNRDEKEQEIRKLNAEFQKAKNLFVAGFQGLTVAQVTLAKALTAYAKNNPLFVFKAGIVEGRVVNLTDLDQIASLPSKEELISKLMFMLNAQAQRLATVLSAVSRNLAVVLNQAAEQKNFSE